jgi:hypothetical protein
METNEKKRNLFGFIGTVLFHALIISLFVFFGLSVPLPLPAEQGVEVNLGNSDDGSGLLQPKTLSEQQQAQPTPASKTDDNYLSQETEEAPKIKLTKNKQQKTEAEKPTIDQPIDKQVNTQALFNKKKNNSNQGGNEGETGKPGDQGNPDGSLYSANHSGNPDGKGQSGKPGGSGVSYSLKGRSHLKLPLPIDNSQKEGIVVVEIRVNASGKVVFANPGARGSNTIDKHLYQAAKEAALKAQFDQKSGAADQVGTITYHFVLQ